MRAAADSTSTDPTALQCLLDEQRAQIEQLTQERDSVRIERDRIEHQLGEAQSRLDAQDAEALHLRTWIQKLKLQIAQLKRLKFGQSSERYDAQIDQLELILEDLEAEQAQRPRPASSEPVQLEPASRKPLPEHLPREVQEHCPDTDCPECGQTMRQIGVDVSEMLEFVPEHFKVIRHERPRYACKGCEKVVQSPAPSRPIERGIAGPALLAHVLTSKYLDHLPLY